MNVFIIRYGEVAFGSTTKPEAIFFVQTRAKIGEGGMIGKLDKESLLTLVKTGRVRQHIELVKHKKFGARHQD